MDGTEIQNLFSAKAKKLDGSKTSATGIEGLKDLMLEGDVSLAEYYGISRQIADYGGTTARDVLLDILKQDGGADRPPHPANYRFNIALMSGRGLAVVEKSLGKEDRCLLKEELANLKTDPNLKSNTRDGISSAFAERYSIPLRIVNWVGRKLGKGDDGLFS